MAPRPATSRTLAAAAALALLTAAAGLFLCAGPSPPEAPGGRDAAGSRAPSAGVDLPGARARAENTAAPGPAPEAADHAPAAGGSAPPEDPGAPPGYALPDVLAAALEQDFPELSLSAGEVEELGAALSELELAIRGIRGLEQGAADAGALAALQGRRDRALRDFERITGMGLAEFLRRAPAEGGIDRGEDDDDEIILEPLAPSRPEPAR